MWDLFFDVYLVRNFGLTFVCALGGGYVVEWQGRCEVSANARGCVVLVIGVTLRASCHVLVCGVAHELGVSYVSFFAGF